MGDPDFIDVPMDEMLSEAYLAKRRALIDPDLAWRARRLRAIRARAKPP